MPRPDHFDCLHTWMYYDYGYDSVWLQQTEARQLQVGVLQNPCYHDMPGMASQTQGLRQPCDVDSGPTPGLNAVIRWEPGWIWPGDEHTKRSPRITKNYNSSWTEIEIAESYPRLNYCNRQPDYISLWQAHIPCDKLIMQLSLFVFG